MSKRIVFFSGAAMDPQLILAAHPSARFIARARVTALAADISSSFSRTLVGRGEAATVWGIAFETDHAEAAETHAALPMKASRSMLSGASIHWWAGIPKRRSMPPSIGS